MSGLEIVLLVFGVLLLVFLLGALAWWLRKRIDGSANGKTREV